MISASKKQIKFCTTSTFLFSTYFLSHGNIFVIKYDDRHGGKTWLNLIRISARILSWCSSTRGRKWYLKWSHQTRVKGSSTTEKTMTKQEKTREGKSKGMFSFTKSSQSKHVFRAKCQFPTLCSYVNVWIWNVGNSFACLLKVNDNHNAVCSAEFKETAKIWLQYSSDRAVHKCVVRKCNLYCIEQSVATSEVKMGVTTSWYFACRMWNRGFLWTNNRFCELNWINPRMLVAESA